MGDGNSLASAKGAVNTRNDAPQVTLSLFTQGLDGTPSTTATKLQRMQRRRKCYYVWQNVNVESSDSVAQTDRQLQRRSITGSRRD